MSKYGYGNVGQSVCVCEYVCAGFWTDRWFLSALVVCRNQGSMSVHSMGGENTHTHTHMCAHKASVVGIRIMTGETLAMRARLAAIQSARGCHPIDWSTLSIRLAGSSR